MLRCKKRVKRPTAMRWGVKCGIGLIAYLCWGVYLLYCIRCTEQKTMKIMYSILLAFAAAVIGLNIYFYLTLK